MKQKTLNRFLVVGLAGMALATFQACKDTGPRGATGATGPAGRTGGGGGGVGQAGNYDFTITGNLVQVLPENCVDNNPITCTVSLFEYDGAGLPVVNSFQESGTCDGTPIINIVTPGCDLDNQVIAVVSCVDTTLNALLAGDGSAILNCSTP